MNPLNQLTTIIIAKNEAQRIAGAIQSVSFCGSVIVIDNGSTDETEKVAKKHGAQVFSFTSDDFSAVRNFGAKEAKSDWIFYLDADEEVTENLRNEIQMVIQSKNPMPAYRIFRKNFFLGREWPTPDQQTRLFQKRYLQGWTGRVHESALVKGAIGTLSSSMNHYTHRTLHEMVQKTNEWSGIEAKLRFDNHHPVMSWWRMFRMMITSFFEYFITQKGYTVGVVGLIESLYQSFSTFITYAKLWEMQRGDTRS